MAIEQTLSIVKPDAVAANQIGAILAKLEEGGLRAVALRMTRLTTVQAREFYAVHKDRPFYSELVAFMTEGPLVVQVLEGDNAVARHRELLGATNPHEAAKGTIRQLFGSNIERNACHGSDSQKTARAEIAFFFRGAELAFAPSSAPAP